MLRWSISAAISAQTDVRCFRSIRTLPYTMDSARALLSEGVNRLLPMSFAMFDTLQQIIPSLFARFIIYGCIGWCVEILFTGVSNAIFQKDRSLTGKTYLWMHPIWGLSCLGMEFLHDALSPMHRVVRIAAYVVVIYIAEFSFGYLLKKTLGKCPWDYTGRGINVMGLIRLDYAPAWALAALFYEPMHTLVAALVNPRLMEHVAQSLIALN
jgi:uncharacterized membrane protein